MKRNILLAIVAVVVSAVSSFAQKEYNMVITLNNGTTITLGHNDIKNITFNDGEISISGDVMTTIEELQNQDDELMRRIDEVFGEVNERLNEVEDRIDERLNEVEDRIDERLNERLNVVVDQLSAEIAYLQAILSDVCCMIEVNHSEIVDLQQRIDNIENILLSLGYTSISEKPKTNTGELPLQFNSLSLDQIKALLEKLRKAPAATK